MLASNGYPGMMAPAMQSAAGIGPYCGPGANGSHAHQYNSPMAAAFWQARHHMPNGAGGAAASSAGGAGVNGMAQGLSHHPALAGHQTSAASGHHPGDAKMAEKIVSELQVHKTFFQPIFLNQKWLSW